MADIGDSYSNLVNLIKDVEASSPKKDSDSINASNIFNQGPSNKAKSTYIDLMELIDTIESRRKAPRAPAAMQGPVQPSHLITAGISQVGNSNIIPETRQPSAQSEVPLQQQFVQPNTKIEAVQEMKEATAKIPSKQMIKASVKRINMKDLVLPSISMSDQISELERIIEGLKESVFDEEHLDIVIQEVYGLSQYVEKADKDLKKRHIELSQLERSLWQIRDQRLKEATAILSGAS
ncbi:MAG: hypothetical protein M1364_02570 [Candidatus Marsarchaeota archaeon]|jgi:hypothetical protein|nr:hypothetical protein [Candidatus Marsarchaeota archaeon]